MRALTIHQPWASLIAEGVKPVENRTWLHAGVVGTRIAIHAGKTFDEDAGLYLSVRPPPVPRISCLSRNVRSAILCTAVVDRFVHRETLSELTTATRAALKEWFVGPVGWVLRDVRTFPPVPCRGAQGLWEVPHEALARIPAEAR